MKTPKLFLLLILTALLLIYPLFAGFSPYHIDLRQENIKIALPIIMYHKVLKGRSDIYVITPEQLESDLRLFNKSGYNFVLPSQIIDFVEGNPLLA